MDTASFLKTSANFFMAAVLAKRVTEDVVRQSPYQAVGAAAVLAVLTGVALGRRRRNSLSSGR